MMILKQQNPQLMQFLQICPKCPSPKWKKQTNKQFKLQQQKRVCWINDDILDVYHDED